MWKKILLPSLIVILAGLGYGYIKYQQIFGPNLVSNPDDSYLLIHPGDDFDDLMDQLKEKKLLRDTASFLWVAKQMSFGGPMRAGRFKIKGGWSNRRLINHLKAGQQAAVKVILTNERLPKDVAGKAAAVILADSAEILRLMQDEAYLHGLGLTPETAMTIMIPNTYELFWTTDAAGFMERMVKEHQTFWSQKDRKSKAENLGMSPEEVYTLASIVERETNNKKERPIIAGLYLNRIEQGIALQADPTVVFAVGDFGLRRVLYKHLEIDSPYNTYKYPGLPPGPISMSSISSIDAVLNPAEHEYIFFCAKGDGSGEHSFAKTLAQHNANRRVYAQNLKARGRR